MNHTRKAAGGAHDECVAQQHRLLIYQTIIFIALMFVGADQAPAADPHARSSRSAPKHTRTVRSSAARRDFRAHNPCPATSSTTGPCPGYIIDHVEPLACGGRDSRENMQWQTVAEAKEKDKVERKNCR